MEQIVKKKNGFMYGAIILTICTLASKLIGAFYRVPMMKILSSEGLGTYQLVFPIYAMFLCFSSGGISIGLSKLISEKFQVGDNLAIKKILKVSIIAMQIFCIFISGIFLALSLIFSSMQGDSSLFLCYLAIMPAIILSSNIAVFRGYFQGLQNMMPTGVSQIIEQIFKLLMSLLLAKILLKYGLIFSVAGALLGVTISEFIALIWIYLQYVKSKRELNKEIKNQIDNNIAREVNNCSYKQTLKLIVKYCFPITLHSIILPIIVALDSLLVVKLLSFSNLENNVSISLFGLSDGVVNSLINLPTVIAISFATALVPNLTALYKENKKTECEKKIAFSLKLIWLITLPCVLIFMLFPQNIINFLYSGGLNSNGINELSIATDLLRFSSLNIIYISFLSMLTAMLQSINKSFLPVRNLLIAAVIKIVFCIILVKNPIFNIYGVAISNIACYSTACILNIIDLKKYINIKIRPVNFVILPLICSGLMCLSAEIVTKLLNNLLNSKVLFLATVLISLLIYLILIFVTKVFSKEEKSNFPKIRFKRE